MKTMLVNKNKLTAFYMSLLSIAMIMNNSIGFDIYWHATSYYYYDEFWNYSDLFFEYFTTPRYLLLSYIYEISSRLGVPVAITVSLLVAIPVYYFFSRQDSLTVVDVCCGILLLLISFFYSGLSLSLIWGLALIKTKNRCFYLGAFFHPGAIIIFAIITLYLGFEYILRYLVYICIFFLFIFLMNLGGFFYSSYSIPEMLRYDIKVENISTFVIKVIDKKSNEIGFVGLVVFVMLFSKAVLYDKLNVILSARVSYLFLYAPSLTLTLLVTFLMSDKVTFFSSVFSGDVNDVIYISWFDWLNRSYNNEFYYVFSLRY
ncbi:hypothetical protein [Vibrio cyclitrophicus]|uniref:hypothetical protein n=1 Tax=Vibrio cyclitrophicus TaxID=47951 RepID=UPI0011B42573|nr:hypothetical protein [Vibrio cyclitrophicus]